MHENLPAIAKLNSVFLKKFIIALRFNALILQMQVKTPNQIMVYEMFLGPKSKQDTAQSHLH